MWYHGRVGSWNEEVVPSDLIASRLREAALFFDSMKYRNKETNPESCSGWEARNGRWKKAVKGHGKTVKLDQNWETGSCSITRIYTYAIVYLIQVGAK